MTQQQCGQCFWLAQDQRHAGGLCIEVDAWGISPRRPKATPACRRYLAIEQGKRLFAPPRCPRPYQGADSATGMEEHGDD